MHPILNVATIAAKNAGEFILSQVNNIDKLSIEHKGLSDYVSSVDNNAERIIIETIKKYYPGHSILAEESGETIQQTKLNKRSNFQWIIDPLDGTTNFLHGLPHYSVSIAVTENNKLKHGVIYDPSRDEIFSASEGQGARLNKFRIRVTEQKTLNNSLLATGFPYTKFDYVEDYVASFKEFMLNTAGIRRAGSAALDLAYVACGRVDGFWEFNLQAWDIAAGAIIVKEAGGFVTDFRGGEGFLQSGNILATNPRLYKEMSKIIGKTVSTKYKI